MSNTSGKTFGRGDGNADMPAAPLKPVKIPAIRYHVGEATGAIQGLHAILPAQSGALATLDDPSGRANLTL